MAFGLFEPLNNRHTCWAGEWVGDRDHLMYRRCGKPRCGWTNYMEPLCHNCFQQRRVIQNLMVMLSGRGSWAGLVISRDPNWNNPWEE